MPDRDQRGRFAKGNSLAAQGGQARAQKLSPQQRSQIAAKGFQTMVERHFDGDRQKAKAWLTARGLWTLDSGYRQRGFGIFPDPGEHPAHKQDQE